MLFVSHLNLSQVNKKETPEKTEIMITANSQPKAFDKEMLYNEKLQTIIKCNHERLPSVLQENGDDNYLLRLEVQHFPGKHYRQY